MPINLKQIIQEETEKLLFEKKNISSNKQKPNLKKFIEQVHAQFKEDKEKKSVGILQHKLKVHGFYDGKKFSEDEEDIQKLYDAVQKVKKFFLKNIPDKTAREFKKGLKDQEYNKDTHILIKNFLGSSSKDSLKARSAMYQTADNMSFSFETAPGSDYLQSFDNYPGTNDQKPVSVSVKTNSKPTPKNSPNTLAPSKAQKPKSTSTTPPPASFSIKYSVKPDGEGFKFVATVVDKSGDEKFKSFEEPLASPNASRDDAYRKVTQKARNFIQNKAKEASNT